MQKKERQDTKQNWIIRQTEYDAAASDFYDSIFFQGNGYIGVRGFQDECITCEDYLRTTFMSGVYEYIKKDISDMVNTPNFFAMTIHTVDKDGSLKVVSPADSVKDSYSRTLDIGSGVLTKSYKNTCKCGTLEVNIDRFLSLDDPHLAAQKLSLTSIDFEGDVEVVFSIDGSVRNNTIHDEQLKKEMNPVSLLAPIGFEKHDAYLLLKEKTPYSGITLAEAMSVDISPAAQVKKMTSSIDEEKRILSYCILLHLAPGESSSMCRKISVCTSRDPECWEDPAAACAAKIMDAEISAPATAAASESAAPASGSAIASAGESSSWDTLYEAHKTAWDKRWADSDIRIEGDDRAQQEVRFAIYNLITNYPVNDPRCSIGARGLTHGRYKGCYFWDTEMYMLPFYLLTHPESARNLLMYRVNTLDTARSEAARFNLEGARYSWMCTPDGKEQCETWDTGSSEIHITADIAYAADMYWRITGDDDFVAEHVLEMMIEICRYWVSRFSYNADTNTYNLLWVKGPNEYGGVTINNTYTVSLAVYGFETAKSMLRMVREKYPQKYLAVIDKTGFKDAEEHKWNQMSGHVHISYDNAGNLLLEDDLFMLAEPADISDLKIGDQPLYKSICFDRLQRMRVLKQADVLLLMGLLPEKFTDAQKKAAWEFYEPITLHDSTLSFGTHSWVGALFGYDDKAFDYFQKSAGLDMRNLMGNTAEEGLHLAAFGGTWMTVVFGFAGLSLRGGDIELHPHLPVSWDSISFPFIYGGKRYLCRVDRDGAKVEPDQK